MRRVPARGRPEDRHVTVTLTARECAVLLATLDSDDWELLADRRRLKGVNRTSYRRAVGKLLAAEEGSKARERLPRRPRQVCPVRGCTQYPGGTCDSCPDWETA